jgi:TonB family protein
LVRTAGLGGRVSVQFLIAGTGQVINSFIQSTTMNSVRVEKCVVDAVNRWEFPKPTGGGIAIVSYPFNFVAGNGS